MSLKVQQVLHFELNRFVRNAESEKDERPHVAAFPFGASFCLLASRAHFPIDEM
jgi:hypothetical protein